VRDQARSAPVIRLKPLPPAVLPSLGARSVL
jgi:hypothetical protein